MSYLGQQVRLFRQQKNISLNAYAKQLGVSPGYLSNLETGKTETIHLSVLEKLQEELVLVPRHELHDKDHNELQLRIMRIHDMLAELQQENPQAVQYLIQTIEKGIAVFSEHSG